jgi:hypothetical protein
VLHDPLCAEVTLALDVSERQRRLKHEEREEQEEQEEHKKSDSPKDLPSFFPSCSSCFNLPAFDPAASASSYPAAATRSIVAISRSRIAASE